MKRIVFLIILSLFIFVSCDDSTNNESEAELQAKYTQADIHAESVSTEISEANSKLAMKLFEKIAADESGKNVMISPLSISIAMAMVANGANDENLTEMKEVLEFSDMDMATVNTQFKELIQSLISADKDLTLEIADSIWIDNQFSKTVKEEFTTALEDYYFTEPFTENFADTATADKINAWCSDNTNGKIDEIIDKIGPDAVMYLINAIYFNAEWTTSFDKSETTQRTFYTKTDEKETEFMHFIETPTLDFKVVKDETYPASVVRLPYGRGIFSFYAILPDDKESDIDAFITNMKETGIDTYLNNLQTGESVELSLPKFKFEYSKSLVAIFKSLGMEKVFLPNGLLNIADNPYLYVTKILHKTLINVNEAGTEAAAVTVAEAVLICSTPEPKKITINHPFVFVIRDDRNGTILFMGKVEDPTAE